MARGNLEHLYMTGGGVGYSIDVDTSFAATRVIMPNLDYRNIEKAPARCGGQAVVATTRIRVATILTCYRQGMSVEEIVQQYSSLKPADVHDALAYAYDHIHEIESDLATDDEQVVKGRSLGRPSP